MIHPPRRVVILTTTLCSLALSSFSTPCNAQAEETASPIESIMAHDVTVSGGVLRPSGRSPTRAAGYFKIQNDSATDLLIQGITSPLCQKVTSNHNSQEMMQISGENEDIFRFLAVPHQSTMVFPAAGYHLLCHGIQKMPPAGTKVPFTFHFMGDATVTTSFTMQNIAAPAMENY